MKKFSLLLLLMIVANITLSQNNIVDSLRQLLKGNINDTVRCNIYYGIIEYEEDDKVWEIYNEEMRMLAENRLKETKEGTHLHNYYLKALGSSYSNSGYLAKFRGDLPSALDYYHRALSVMEKVNDKKTVAGILNNLAFINKSTGQMKLGVQQMEKTISIFRELKDSTGIGTGLNNIGTFYNDMGEYGKSIEASFESLKYLQAPRHDRVKAYAFNNIGLIYLKMGDTAKSTKLKDSLYKLSMNYYDISLKMRERLADKRGMSFTLHGKALVLLQLNRLSEAKQYGERSLALSKEIGYPENIQRAAGVLSNIYSKTGEWQKAYEMHYLYKQMTDSVSNENNRKASLQKSFQYAYEKKAAADSVRVEEERKVVQAELKQEKTKNIALYGGLAFVGLFGAFMYNRFKVTQKQNILINTQKIELQKQKEIVENHQKETLDSIHYAKRIQTALIANSAFINEHLQNNFIYFNPKDIVSGDFYWAAHHNSKFFLAICDSTGHGVPGAFMSLLNIGFLSEAVKEKNIEQPNKIFNYVRERLISTISDESQKDGMDGILLCIDKIAGSITYSAANNAPLLIRNQQILELPKDKMPVGKGEVNREFTLFTIQTQPGDMLYLYTDGFADQFGGPKGKKFKYKQLNELLLSINDLDVKLQKQKLQLSFNEWKGELEQVDDVCIAGIKIK